MEDLTPEQKIDKAVSGLVRDNILFAMLVTKMEIIPSTRTKTGWTDGKTIGYNPAFINTLTLGQTKTFLAHEGLHPGLKHHLRRGKRDNLKYNKAGDYVINDILTDSDFEAIPDWLLRQEFKNLDTETVYNIVDLEEEQKKEEERKNESHRHGRSSVVLLPGPLLGRI